MQEHRDAILQRQMLGRKLLSELTRRHNSRQNLPQELKGYVQEVFPAGFLPEEEDCHMHMYLIVKKNSYFLTL